MFRKFFTFNKNGEYIELNMNPLPPPMRVYNVTRQYLKVLDDRTKQRIVDRNQAMLKDPKIDEKTMPDEPYWCQSKTIECVKPTLILSIKYRFMQNLFNFTMPFFMKFYLKELKKAKNPTKEGAEPRRLWLLLSLATGATISCFIGALMMERANFYTGATKAKAGQTLRSLIYKRIAIADFMFLQNVDAGVIARLGMFEVDGIQAFIGGFGDMFTSPIFILLTFAYIISEKGASALLIMFILLGCLGILNFLNFKGVKIWRNFTNEGNARAIALRELIPNVDEVKKCGQEDFFHKKLNMKRNEEMSALKNVHNINNALNFTFELTFLMGAFLNVFLYINNLKPGKELDTGEAFSQIALVNGMRGGFSELMTLVVNISEYKMSKKAMELVLNNVQVKPEESEGYYDKELEVGTIKGEMCEFAINDKEHIDIIRGLKNLDPEGPPDPAHLNVWTKQQQLKDEIDKEAMIEKKKMMGISIGNEDPESQFANTTVIFNQRSFEVFPGEKCCIVGAEDDGKSMFLFSLLGETELVHGSLKLNGTMGFCSLKRASFVSGTVRDNITLFNRYHKKQYEKSCQIAMLNTGRMPGDDFMQVADSGANLFAKEKMQIIVARLVYQDPDIFILDDFLDYLQ